MSFFASASSSRDRLRRRLDPGRVEHVLVVVEAVVVGEQRHRAAVALVLRCSPGPPAGSRRSRRRRARCTACRSIQPPDEQKAPVLSVLNESVTSGALPPRSAATILSSLTLPTLSTVTFGFCFSKSSMTPLKTSSSRPVKPVHSVIVTGLPSYLAAALSPPPESSSPPMQPDAPSATAPARSATTTRLNPIPTALLGLHPSTQHLVRKLSQPD